MPRNGNGGYSLPNNSWNPAINGAAATAADWQNLINDVAAAIQQSLSSDGQTPMTGNLNMGGFVLTGLGSPSGAGQSLRWEQLTKGADIASAAALPIPVEGAYFNVTGTTTITSFADVYPGRLIYLKFAGAVRLTNSASLVLPNLADYTTMAGDVMVFLNDSPGVWLCVAYPNRTLALGTFRNKLINAQGTVNQRVYVSGVATTGANQYALDRWRVVTSGQNLSFSASGIYQIMTAPAGGVEQIVEGTYIEGGRYSLSWVGTATATVNGTTIANGSAITLIAGANATVRFIGGTFSLPQLELGWVTPFEYLPPDINLSRCQRYYEKSYPQAVAPGGVGGGGHQSMVATGFLLSGPTIYFKVTKRATPSLFVYSPQTGGGGLIAEFNVAGTFVSDRAAAATNIGTTAYTLGGTGGMTAGNYITAHWLADSEL